MQVRANVYKQQLKIFKEAKAIRNLVEKLRLKQNQDQDQEQHTIQVLDREKERCSDSFSF